MPELKIAQSNENFFAPSCFTAQTLELTPTDEIEGNFSKVLPNASLNFTLSVTGFFEELKNLILGTETEAFYPKTIEEIQFYKKEILGNSKPENDLSDMPGGCPDVEFIDLRNVPGYPQIDDLNVCGAADTLSMIIFTGDPGEIKGFEFEIDLPDGIEYAGWEFTQLKGTSINASDPDPNRPTFLVDGITGDSLVVVNIGIRTNCEVDKGEMLFFDYNFDYVFIDTSNILHKCSGTFTPSQEFNSSVHVPVLNMLSPLSPADATITTLGTPGCQTITLSQDGLSSYLDSFMFEIVGLELFGGDLILSSIEVNDMLVPSGDISYNAGTETTSLNVDGTYFPANSLNSPADDKMNTNEVVEIEVCFNVNNCPDAADIPFNYLAYWGCDDMICETTSQTSFIKVRPSGSLPATATANLNAEGIEICGTPGIVSITLTNPNIDTDQNTYTDLEIGFQTCDKPNLEVTNVMVGGVTLPASYYEWVGDDINIDFTSNMDDGLGLVDQDGDGFYDDMLGGSSISAEVTIEVSCGIGEGDCANINCEDVQFYVSGKTNCGNTFKDYPVPEMFDLIYGATLVENRNEYEIATGVFGYDFGTYSDNTNTVSADSSVVEVEFCYSFEKLNIEDCPTGGSNFLRVEFSGAPQYILDLQFDPGTAEISIDSGMTYTAIADGDVTLTKPSDNLAILELNQGSNNMNVCYKYSIELDTCLCLPNAFFAANQQVVHICEECDPDCEILKACRPVLFEANAHCSPCPCIVQNRHVRSERKNLGFTDKTMTTRHTRESLLDSLAANGETSADLTRFLPGDTLIHEDYFVLTDQLALENLNRWTWTWTMYELGTTNDSISKLPLVMDAHNTVLTDFSVSKVGGARTFADLDAILSCNSNGNTSYGNVWVTAEEANTPYPLSADFGGNSFNSSVDYLDNNLVGFRLWNFGKIDDCGGSRGDWGTGNCLDDFVSTYDIQVGDTLHFTWEAPLIKNPHREILKSLGTAPAPADFARIYTSMSVYKMDLNSPPELYCDALVGSACREWGAFELDCPGEIDAVTRMDLNDCGGTVSHEFTVRDLPGPVGDPWYKQEYRPMMDLFDIDVLIRAPLAYCANARVEKLGVTYDVSVDSTINMFCNPVAGYDEDICAVETGDVGNVVFDLFSQGIPGMGVGLDNCDTLRLKYDLCMVCPGDISGVLDYTLVYDWAFSGTNLDVDRSVSNQYVCNYTTAAHEGRTICDEMGLASGFSNYWDALELDTMMFKNDRVSEVFILTDMRDPLTPVSVTNNSPNIIASGGPGVAVELQEIELCNPDVDDDATGVGMSVTVPSAVRLEDVFTDAAGTMALAKTLISDDGLNKVYKITLPTNTYIPNECNTFYVGTTLLFCPNPMDAPPKICVGAFSGCAPEDVKAALAASGGCAGSEVCYTYIFGQVGLQTEWFDIPPSFPLCDTVMMNVLVKNTKELVLLDLLPMFDLPPGLDVVPGSWEVRYPGGPTTFGTWTNIPTDPDIVSGNTYSYSDDGLWNAWINANGLQGVSTANTTADSNKVAFRFEVVTNCGEFLSGAKALTETTASDPCSDQMVSSGLVQSEPLVIQGAEPINYAQLLLVSNPEIINCEGTVNTFGITAINSGTKSTSDSVLICVTFPEGLDYQTGTVMFTSPLGFPTGMVTETPIGTSTEICFSGPEIGPYGSMSMTFDAAMDLDQECGDIYLLADIKSFESLVKCTPSPPDSCGVFIQNSINNRVDVELSPPFVAEDIEVFTSCPNAEGNVELSYEFTINHNGPDASNQSYTVNFYEDVDGSLDVNPNVDNLLGSESGTFSVNDGATVMLSGTVDVPDGQSCPVLFEVVYATGCTCDRTEEYFDNIKFEGLREYDEPLTMCPGSCIDIEICDHVLVTADSVKGSTGAEYTPILDWNAANLYSFPRSNGQNGPPSAFISYAALTDDSIGNGDNNLLLAEQTSGYDDAHIVASYPCLVQVERIYMGGGNVSGWTGLIHNYGTLTMKLEYSLDGITWTLAETGLFIPTTAIINEIVLATPVVAQYFRVSSNSVNRNWATSEFRLEGAGIPYEGFAPVSVAGNTATICIPDGVGIDAPWPVTFTTGTGNCEVEETLEIWGIGTPGITLVGDTTACENQCVGMEILVPNDATAGMTVSWTPAALIDDPTAFRVEACSLSMNTTFQATISYNDGACVQVIDWPVEYFPENTIDVQGEVLDCYNMVEPPVLTGDAGWDLYNWYQVIGGTGFIGYSSTENTFVPTPGATYYLQASRAGTMCPAVSEAFTIPNNACLLDLGDLPDTGAGTSNVNYETLLANNGPYHIIIDGLHLGPNVDEELDGQPSADALGDGTDENATDFPGHLDIKPNSTFRLPLSVVNTTGETAHLEAWIDWNGDGEFTGLNEMILDIDDSASLGVFPTDFTVTVPSDAAINTILGVRFRLSNTDDMTPYGLAEAGEIEDYLIQLDCDPNTCLPVNVIISNGGN